MLKNLAGATINRGSPAGTMFGAARIENAGTVNVQAGTLGEPAPGAAGAYAQSSGTTTISADATLSMSATLSGGTLRGAGTVRSLVNSGGTVAPGLSPGALTVAGDFTQAPGGTLAEEIAGPLDAQFDRLIVGGAASLAGTLAIASDPGYAPAPQSILRFLTAASVTGTFASLTGAQVGDSSLRGRLPRRRGTALLRGLRCAAGDAQAVGDALRLGRGRGQERRRRPRLHAGLRARVLARDRGDPDREPGLRLGLRRLVGAVQRDRGVRAHDGPGPRGDGDVLDLHGPAVHRGRRRPRRSSSTRRRPARPRRRKLSAKDVLFLPSTKRCVAKGRLSVRVRVPAGVTARRATVVVRGRQRKAASGSALARSFVSPAPRSGPFTAKLTLTLADGRSVSASARYKACRTR